ncbi:MAG TPA: hypothetical protein DCZ84_03135 [Candidatus Vogelbacteria bacterium]|uniref:Uncharacterized protein n=1 Tax=Candidatus Vogelbacteria bacterium RIFOXYD1_FULL_51_18 TaxID=1802440 RepID=A0A1G2QKK3_9BACT|nr:MAG: hypothetical protein UY66_C0012G0008 [Parcubacteria group bacterium GW2011_GWC1_51_35]KKW24297.1 MAG: hypothetical protein UY68_C0012G0038 [Parcubacteria group bacterium GW2011_GWF2_52_12]OHA60522.1 MAG: hypothetical protein A2569_01995 [Candidatus Vogelbacteria bacterium RIFOXYD1_FULL_51_18]HBB65598.1 hypothetical protein [Candidatus Vogelbacteria bacterium]HBC44145.1 hypothetical protein [Candidatus Vogelbacteria bacterium]
MVIDAIFYYIYKLMQFLRGLFLAFIDGDLARLPAVAETIHWYKVFAIIISGLLAAGLIWVAFKIRELNMARSLAEEAEMEHVAVESNRTPNEARWQFIQDKLSSSNESDWRMAIIEADSILGEIVGTMNLPGASLGDKLKVVEKSDFVSLDDAWEAHKARNRIAHDGSALPLSEREARRIVGLYERVFKEFDYL